jgi:hypothetical protein
MPEGERFLKITMPDRFILDVRRDDGTWIDWGIFDAELFARLPDGSYVCAGHGPSTMWLRCIAQRGEVLEVLDGAGGRHHYRLVEID